MLNVAIGVVINEFKGVLITLRSALSASYPSHWEFPGGKIEEGEKAETAIIRELKEEVNIFCHSVDFWKVHEENGVRLHVFWVKEFSGQVRCLEDQQALKWVAVQNLLQHTFPPSNKLLVEQMQRLGVGG